MKVHWKKLISRHLLTEGLAFWRELVAHVRQAQLLMVASSLAYTTILSIIPVLAVSFAIFKAFGGMERLYGIIEPLVLSNLAQSTSTEVIDALHRFIDNTHASAVGVGGLIALIITSMSMLSSAETAINRVWQAKLRRSFFSRIAAYWLFITLGPLAISVAVGAATSSNYPLARLFPSGFGMYLVSVALFFCIYKWVPHCPVNWRFSLVSALCASGSWELARWGYSIYTSRVVTYSKIYGSLGAVPILLLWIYISWIIVLSGAALTATLEKRFGEREAQG